MDIGTPPNTLPEPLVPVPLPTSLVTQEEQALLDGTSHLTIQEEEEEDSKEETFAINDDRLFSKMWIARAL